MKRRITVSLIGFLMAMLMAFGMPLNVFAANESIEYLSDVRICYNTPNRSALEKQGYKVFQNNLNETGDGKEVYICYKTTRDRSEAITDLALMNMSGSYDFDKYQTYLAGIIAEAKTLADDLIVAVTEFAENCKSKPDSVTVKATLKMLNMFYDDDTKDKDGNDGKLLGDMIVDGDMTHEVLNKIFYQGKLEFVNAIENAISIGLTEIGDNTLVYRMATKRYTNSINASRNVERARLMGYIAEAKEYYLQAEKYANAAKEYESTEKYLEQFGEKEKITVAEHISSYEAATACYYGADLLSADGENRLTVFEAITLPTQDEFDVMLENGEVTEEDYCMDEYMADILLRSLTDGQSAVLTSVELKTLINNSYYLNINEDPETKLNEAVGQLDVYEKASIYDGVDRTLFTHIEDIAMTYTASTNIKKTDYVALGRTAEKCDKAAMICGIVLGVSILGGFLGTLAIVQLFDGAEDAMRIGMVGALTPRGAIGIGAKFGIGLAVVCLLLVLAIILLKVLKPNPNPPKITYTKIPRVMVDSATVDGEQQYYTYYCAKLVNAVAGYDDYMDIYGDLNGYGEHSDWLCLYYTKDTRAGKPLSANFIKKYTVDNNMNKTTGYLTVHIFGSVGAENLNYYVNMTTQPKEIYLYVQYADAEYTASIFADSAILSNAIFFVVGAGLSVATTVLVMKKKNGKKVAA